MRLTVLILSLAIGIGIAVAAPYFLHDIFGGAGITNGTSSIEIKWVTISWTLRGLGICIGLGGVLYALLPKHDSDA